MTISDTEVIILSGASAKSKDLIDSKIGGVPNGTPPFMMPLNQFSVHDQTLAGHLGGLVEAHQVQHGRAQVAELAALLAQLMLGMIGIDDNYSIASAYRNPKLAAKYTKQLLEMRKRPTCILYPDDYSAIGGLAVQSTKSNGVG